MLSVYAPQLKANLCLTFYMLKARFATGLLIWTRSPFCALALSLSLSLPLSLSHFNARLAEPNREL